MNLKRTIGTATLATGVGVASLFGVGLGTAAADPGQPCGGPNAQSCQNGSPQGHNGHQNGPAQAAGDWQHRGIDQGRQDHSPFQYNGQRVEPMRAGNGDGWGFWFLGKWIRL